MSTLRYALAVGAVLVAAASPADAQLRRVGTTVVPDASSMPVGVCRVWLDGVPASRQPAPTDCETARRTRPRDARIIYGTRQRTADNGRWERERAERERERQESLRRQERERERERLEERRRQERERERYAKQQEKEREKEWKREHRGNGRYRNGNDRDGRRDDDRYSTTQQGCIDANRDGVCDAAQRTQSQPVPQTIPPSSGSTRRVCVDANRDGKCDDGGPLIRTTP